MIKESKTQKPSSVQETAVFDFDGTLISKDSYFEFNKRLISQSVARSIFLVLALPLIIPLVCISATRKYGFNVACFIAIFLQRKSLFRLRTEFIEYFLASPTVVYYDVLQAIIQSQTNGQKVVFISGCPKWLLSGLLKSIGVRNVKLVGTEQKLFLGTFVIKNHCYGANKIRMARIAGQQSKNWSIGYSDSPMDIPMLNLCKTAVLVNPSASCVKRFRHKLAVPYTHHYCDAKPEKSSPLFV